MLNGKMIALVMAFGAVLGFWFMFSITGALFSVWNFITAFIAGVIAFLVVYYFYKFFY